MKYKVLMTRTEVYSTVIEVEADSEGAAYLAAYNADFAYPDDWDDVDTVAKIIKPKRKLI